MSYRVLPAQRVIVFKPTLGVFTVAEPGDTIIPHLYDWFFDGVDDYVVFTNQPYFDFTDRRFTISFFRLVDVKALQTLEWILEKMVYSPSRSGWSITRGGDYGIEFWSDGSPLGAIPFPIVFNTPTDISMSVNYDTYITIRNGAIISQGSFNINPPSTTANLVLGRSMAWGIHMNAYLSALAIHTAGLSSQAVTEMHLNKIVTASDLKLFADATFYNGTHYVDLSGNGNHGYPYGGVSRVPASRTWFWRVKGLYQGDKVKVLIPPMTRYRIGTGSWQENNTWNTIEILLDPGLISIVMEGL